MWLFSDAIANLRNRVKFEMHLTTHQSARLAGQRVIYTSITETPLRNPLLPTQRAEVEVEYNNNGRLVHETLPTAYLLPKDAHTGCCHVVITDCVLPQGTIVDISKIMKDVTWVVWKGQDKMKKSNLITISTCLLCPVQTVDTVPNAVPMQIPMQM